MEMTWRPIQTHPAEDPNAVLLFWPYWTHEPVIGELVNGVWWTEKWLGEDSADPGPTHWMPLPDNPGKEPSPIAPCAARLETIQRGLIHVDPMRRSSPETTSCVFCGADKTYSYVTGDRTPHTDDCEWRLACEARGVPWNHVL